VRILAEPAKEPTAGGTRRRPPLSHTALPGPREEVSVPGATNARQEASSGNRRRGTSGTAADWAMAVKCPSADRLRWLGSADFSPRVIAGCSRAQARARARDARTAEPPHCGAAFTPRSGVAFTIHLGGTAVIMEHFDPEQFIRLIEQYQVTHTQLVPTMFSRMLKLPDDVRRRYDLSSLEIAIHAAAPCPVKVKEQMIEWWGPIIFEYYGMTEAIGFTACDSAEWLTHKGTVGRVLFGDLNILDEAMNPVPTGTVGTVWFRLGSPFEYFNDKARTAESLSPDGTMGTVGDVGYVDADGYLYLTDRATFMIISGGVNIYPQECEDLLITHPKVADAAVFGVPNADLGEEVKAVVQPVSGVSPNAELADELIAFCREHLAHLKCPRSIDFEPELPRLPTGKLYKRTLRDRYWAGRTSHIV
jgi:long-chain acyl-CoA synthetase